MMADPRSVSHERRSGVMRACLPSDSHLQHMFLDRLLLLLLLLIPLRIPLLLIIGISSLLRPT